MIITLSTDSDYVDRTVCLLNSISINSPDFKVYLRAIDCKESEITALKAAHNNLILDDEQVGKCTKRKFFRAGAVLSTNLLNTGPYKSRLLSERQCYVSNTRYRNILYCLQELNEDIVIFLDADAIVRRNLSDLTNFINKYDVLCNVGTEVPRYPNGRCWECSCIIARNTPETIAFFNKVRELTEVNMTDWDSDQFAIENIYSTSTITLCDDISHIEDLGWRVLTVDNWKETSSIYSSDTYIWPGSGEGKFTEEYCKEQKKYTI
jgi:hypothetical protein